MVRAPGIVHQLAALVAASPSPWCSPAWCSPARRPGARRPGARRPVALVAAGPSLWWPPARRPGARRPGARRPVALVLAGQVLAGPSPWCSPARCSPAWCSPAAVRGPCSVSEYPPTRGPKNGPGRWLRGPWPCFTRLVSRETVLRLDNKGPPLLNSKMRVKLFSISKRNRPHDP